jgi:hypothetical protein
MRMLSGKALLPLVVDWFEPLVLDGFAVDWAKALPA